MALTFPNRSRSYDAAAKRIRFIGYDGMFEVPFFVEVEAFSTGTTALERDHLAAFDAAREAIHNIAQKAYSKRRRNIYVLTRVDFK